MTDVLFSTIEQNNSERTWGSFLDAGTGVHSLKWIQNLQTTSWTAITADNQMKHQIESDGSIVLRSQDRLIVGNWMDDAFCSQLGMFDTILADYLIGAVDGFSPYEQDVILDRLRKHLNPRGRLYVVGMNPIPDSAPGPANVVTEVRRARDACIQLAGHRPYREFPLDWMIRHLMESQFTVVKTKKFTILHSEESILRQIRVARGKIAHMNSCLTAAMNQYLDDLTARVQAAVQASSDKRLHVSFDYVMVVDPADSDTNTERAASSSSSSLLSSLPEPPTAASVSASANAISSFTSS